MDGRKAPVQIIPMTEGIFDKSVFERAGANLSEWFSHAFDLAELARGSTVSLAVTGLSRAGKTVFITSLVHNLLSALHQPYRMPFLKVAGDGRLAGARLAGDKTDGLPRFPYRRNIESMAASPPNWPARVFTAFAIRGGNVCFRNKASCCVIRLSSLHTSRQRASSVQQSEQIGPE